MSDDARKGLALLSAVLLVGVALFVVGPRWLAWVGGPENEIITRLKALERSGFEVAVLGAPLKSDEVHYQRLSVRIESDGRRAVASGTLDFTGRFDGTTAVSSLGLERIDFELRDGEWLLRDGPAPRLASIVSALEGRRRQLTPPLSARDRALGRPTAGRRTYTVEAWYIRSEREAVEVAEDHRLQETLPERPVDVRATTRLELRETQHGNFVFQVALE